MSEQHAAWLRLHKAFIFETETRARSFYRPMGEIGPVSERLSMPKSGLGIPKKQSAGAGEKYDRMTLVWMIETAQLS
ncbi:hypothetical protein E4U57_001900 [Claviceps arundinis]|uniref:Uncharacterized protein n=1 Tax=Claviceps arundinis TaxID=1623583 RepID=A0ABQ7PBJ6_9HYPO|nr:hypothetical protein E4U57_001900 [Claviceps arundinis]